MSYKHKLNEFKFIEIYYNFSIGTFCLIRNPN